ncbi:GGDEF domain-containing protein [Amycolatopsis tolypomycina]|uniref:GGDEF domain-containing protein n=1 Tax=Amycolatopsis tolypomycina TaxID=208445 RepID=UPI0033BC8AFB
MLLACGWAVLDTLRLPGVEALAWLQLVVLAGCSIAYHQRTRAAEERRRGTLRRANREHVDQTSIFFFPAALILPAPLAIVIVVLLRALRYRIAHTPLHRYAFTTAAIVLSVLGVHTIAEVTPLGAELAGHLPLRGGNVVATLAVVPLIGAAIGWYFAAQAAIVGIARGLVVGGTARRTRRAARIKPGARRAPRTRAHWNAAALLGDWATNRFILITLLLASLVALATAFSVFMLLAAAAVAIAATRSERELRERTTTSLYDDMTGLLRRAQFELAATLKLEADAARGRATALLFADVDDFKGWNTRLGHDGGDQVLCELAKTLKAIARRDDVIGRWGGEEFVLALPDADADAALATAERLRDTFSRIRITADDPVGGGELVINDKRVPGEGFTVSIGVAISPQHGGSIDVLKTRASIAMQQAKKDGKNRVVLASGGAPHRSPVGV